MMSDAAKRSICRWIHISFGSRLKRRNNPVGIEDAAAPGAAAGLLQAAQSRVSSGRAALGAKVGAGRAARQNAGAFLRARNGVRLRPRGPWSRHCGSGQCSTRMMSPSSTLPMGPPARPSGPMWPMQAPVETPEKRASVSSATCLPNGRCLQRAGHLIGFLHAGAQRPNARQDQHVARPGCAPV